MAGLACCPLACNSGSLDFGELLQPGAADRLPQLEDAAGLDLPDPLPRDPEQPGHLVERLRLAVLQPVPEFDHLALPLGQRPQDLADPLAEQVLIDVLARRGRATVAEEVLQGPLAVP